MANVTRVTAGLTQPGVAPSVYNITLKCEFAMTDDVADVVEAATKQLREYYNGCYKNLVEGNV